MWINAVKLEFKLGAKSKLTPEIEAKILSLYESGVPICICSAAVGLSRATAHSWVVRGEKETNEGIESEYSSFFKKLYERDAKKISSYIQEIERGDKTWKAYDSLLTKRWPRSFSPQSLLADELQQKIDMLKELMEKTGHGLAGTTKEMANEREMDTEGNQE